VSETARFSRAIVIVVDSVGVGELPDAGLYGDQGSNTLGNIAARVRLQLPTLGSLGLTGILPLRGLPPEPAPAASFGKMAERSPGKDSVTGHWELMGLVVDRPFPVFPGGFPAPLVEAFSQRIGRRVLGNVPASGTEIIERLGPEHIRTGCPIVYTSADSVFQIAVHEEVIPVAELYRQCQVAYELAVEGLGVGRVIARPFVGAPGAYQRTSNRRDFAMPPPADTLLDRVSSSGLPVVAIGKIEDLFARRGITEAIHTVSDDDGLDQVERALGRFRSGLIVVNLVDCDTVYGHRNNVEGYAANLERFDARLGELLPALLPGDLLVLTADHGNDPTTPSTDHSREYVPLLVVGPRVAAGIDLGTRETFADLGQTLAEALGVAPMPFGASFLGQVTGN